MATSGVTGSSLPPGDDALIRRIQDLERVVRELGPGLMAAITPAINTLTAQQATLTTAVANITTLIGAQVQSGSVGTSAIGFAPTTTLTDVASANITVPSGFTQAVILVTVDVSAANTTASGAYLYVSARAGAGGGGESFNYCPAGVAVAGPASAIRTFTGLSGGTITVNARVRTSAGTWTYAANQANVNAIALFLR